MFMVESSYILLSQVLFSFVNYETKHANSLEIFKLQWSPSNLDTLGTRESGQISEVSSFQGLILWHGCGLSLKLMM